MANAPKKLSAYNRHVKKQRLAGKSMKQAAASWDKKKQKPKASAAKASSSTRSKSKAKSTGGRSTVSKNGFNTAKIFKYVRLAALAAPAAGVALGPGTPEDKIKKGLLMYTGYDMVNQRMRWDYLAQGWLPFLGASLVTYGIPKATAMMRKL